MKSNQILNRLQHELEARKSNNSYRELNKKSALSDFSSNDYLGLSIGKASGTNLGSGGSRLLAGNTDSHEELESFISEFHKSEAAILFSSGYTANVGLMSTVPKRGEVIIYDELIHASIRDGIKMTNARSFSFKHNNVEDLKLKLSRAEEPAYVVIESLYSMDGDFSPLQDLVDVCNEFGALLIVDEAHSVGLYGKEGRGLVSKYGLEKEVFARILTYGKAFGYHGATVVGSQLLKDYLINYCRSFIYTTAPSVHEVNTLKSQYDRVIRGSESREKLFENISLFLDLSGKKQVELSPIQTVLIPGNDEVRNKANEIQLAGFDVRPVMSPTVPEGEERLRICIHSYNSKEEIESLVNLLNW